MDILKNKSDEFTNGFNFALALTDLMLHAGDSAEQSMELVRNMILSYQLSPHGVALDVLKQTIQEIVDEEGILLTGEMA